MTRRASVGAALALVLPSVALGLLALGCGYDAGETVPLTDLDAPFYAAHVQPILATGCASLDCHGVDGRPLRLYSEDGLRRRDDLRGQPLSAGELAWNVEVFEAIDPDAPSADENVALTKPLAVDAGGLYHVGGDLWATRDDPRYRCLRTWLAGELDPGPCAEALPAP